MPIVRPEHLIPLKAKAWLDLATIGKLQADGFSAESVRKHIAQPDVRVISPHAVRHISASILAQRGVSLFKIAAWMGHSTAQVTELYAHLTAYDDDIGRLNNPTPAEAEKAAVQPAIQ